MNIRSAFERIIKARERQAQLYVNGILLNFDDETLARSGFDRAELKKRAATRYFL